MLLTLTTTHPPATDLGYLLHQEPGAAAVLPAVVRAGARLLPGGDRGALHGRAAARRRPGRAGAGRAGRRGRALEQYVNDRPYVASSFLSVAIAQVLRHRPGRREQGPAGAGRDADRRSRPGSPCCPAAAARRFLRRLFEPLGYAVTRRAHPLDEQFPEWGDSRYFTVTLRRPCRLASC